MATQKESYSARLIRSFRTRGVLGFIKQSWIRFWMLFVGVGPAGRVAAWLVTWFAPPNYDRWELRFLNPKGFVSPKAMLHGKDICLGRNSFVDDRAVIFHRKNDGLISIGAESIIARDTVIEASKGGSVVIGDRTLVQPHCYVTAAQASIRIGSGVAVGPYCAFYPHDHGTFEGQDITGQDLVVKGDIVVEDGVWLGHGVTVLSGARIGRGAVIGAGSVVTHDVPENAIACGVPAKVLKKRPKRIEPPVLRKPVVHSEAGSGVDRL